MTSYAGLQRVMGDVIKLAVKLSESVLFNVNNTDQRH